MPAENESPGFREVDAGTAKSVLRSALERLNLTREELLLGKVDEDGDVVWSGSPRSLFERPRTWPTVDGIVDDVLGAQRFAGDHEERDQ